MTSTARHQSGGYVRIGVTRNGEGGPDETSGMVDDHGSVVRRMQRSAERRAELAGAWRHASRLVIDGYQARDGSNRAVDRNIAFADGRPLFFIGSQPDGSTPQP